MTQGIGSGESAEVRKAIERLQHTLGIMGERYRDLRHERRQMRARIEQLEREQEAVSLSLSARLETAEYDRGRVSELEERALRAEKAEGELSRQLSELDQALTERDAVIADQAGVIERQRQHIEEERRREAENWTVEERFHADVQHLREQLAHADAEVEQYKQQMREMEEEQRGQLSSADENIRQLNHQIDEMRAVIHDLEAERAELLEAQAQLDLRLNGMMRDVAVARNHVAEIESEIESFRTQLLHANAAREEVTAELSRLQTELEETRARLESGENELRSLHESMHTANADAARRTGDLQGEVATLQLDLERAQKARATMEADRDSARGTVESLLARLKQLEASDDERLKAQRVRIDELTLDLSEALDMAANKETELLLAQSELERLRRQVSELNERRDALMTEVETLHGANTNGQANASTAINDNERRAIVDQLRDAITLIDKHLGDQ